MQASISSSSSRMGDYGSSSSSSYGGRRHSHEYEQEEDGARVGDGSSNVSRNFLPPLAFESQGFSASGSGSATGNGGWSQQSVQRSPHTGQYQQQQQYDRPQQYDDRQEYERISPVPSSASSHGRSSSASQHQARFASILSDERRDSVTHYSHSDLVHPSAQYARPGSSSGGRHSPHWRSFEEARPPAAHATGATVSSTTSSRLAPAPAQSPGNRLGLHFGPGASSSSGVAPGDTPLRKSCQHCRKRKIRCIPTDDDAAICKACRNKKQACVFEKQSTMGRPPKSALKAKAEEEGGQVEGSGLSKPKATQSHSDAAANAQASIQGAKPKKHKKTKEDGDSPANPAYDKPRKKAKTESGTAHRITTHHQQPYPHQLPAPLEATPMQHYDVRLPAPSPGYAAQTLAQLSASDPTFQHLPYAWYRPSICTDPQSHFQSPALPNQSTHYTYGRPAGSYARQESSQSLSAFLPRSETAESSSLPASEPALALSGDTTVTTASLSAVQPSRLAYMTSSVSATAPSSVPAHPFAHNSQEQQKYRAPETVPSQDTRKLDALASTSDILKLQTQAEVYDSFADQTLYSILSAFHDTFSAGSSSPPSSAGFGGGRPVPAALLDPDVAPIAKIRTLSGRAMSFRKSLHQEGHASSADYARSLISPMWDGLPVDIIALTTTGRPSASGPFGLRSSSGSSADSSPASYDSQKGGEEYLYSKLLREDESSGFSISELPSDGQGQQKAESPRMRYAPTKAAVAKYFQGYFAKHPLAPLVLNERVFLEDLEKDALDEVLVNVIVGSAIARAPCLGAEGGDARDVGEMFYVWIQEQLLSRTFSDCLAMSTVQAIFLWATHELTHMRARRSAAVWAAAEALLRERIKRFQARAAAHLAKTRATDAAAGAGSMKIEEDAESPVGWRDIVEQELTVNALWILIVFNTWTSLSMRLPHNAISIMAASLPAPPTSVAVSASFAYAFGHLSTAAPTQHVVRRIIERFSDATQLITAIITIKNQAQAKDLFAPDPPRPLAIVANEDAHVATWLLELAKYFKDSPSPSAAPPNIVTPDTGKHGNNHQNQVVLARSAVSENSRSFLTVAHAILALHQILPYAPASSGGGDNDYGTPVPLPTVESLRTALEAVHLLSQNITGSNPRSRTRTQALLLDAMPRVLSLLEVFSSTSMTSLDHFMLMTSHRDTVQELTRDLTKACAGLEGGMAPSETGLRAAVQRASASLTAIAEMGRHMPDDLGMTAGDMPSQRPEQPQRDSQYAPAQEQAGLAPSVMAPMGLMGLIDGMGGPYGYGEVMPSEPLVQISEQQHSGRSSLADLSSHDTQHTFQSGSGSGGSGTTSVSGFVPLSPEESKPHLFNLLNAQNSPGVWPEHYLPEGEQQQPQQPYEHQQADVFEQQLPLQQMHPQHQQDFYSHADPSFFASEAHFSPSTGSLSELPQTQSLEGNLALSRDSQLSNGAGQMQTDSGSGLHPTYYSQQSAPYMPYVQPVPQPIYAQHARNDSSVYGRQ